MARRTGLSWLLFFLWAAWLFALQGLFADPHGLGRWTPELGLCLLLAIDGRLPRGSARFAALLVAGARIAFSTDPPLGLVAGYLAVVGVTGALRELVDVDRPFLRALFAAVLALLLTSFWALSRSAVLAAEGSFPPPVELAWRMALTTAAASVLLAPLLVRLPGLRPLARRRP